MSHEAALFTTAFGVISNAVSTAKNAVELSKNVKDHDLKSAVSNVLDSVMDAKVKIIDLEDENRALRKQVTDLEAKAIEQLSISRSGEHGYWFKEAEDSPLCPRCYEGSRQVTYLSPVQAWGVYRTRSCRVCDFSYEENRVPSSGPTFSAKPSLSSQLRGY